MKDFVTVYSLEPEVIDTTALVCFARNYGGPFKKREKRNDGDWIYDHKDKIKKIVYNSENKNHT